METPLDVLSRAATLVETDPEEGDVSYSLGGRSESPKELPSRLNRQRRSGERRDGPLVMKTDGDRDQKSTGTSTRCASTQTLITSEMVGIPEINPDLPIPSSSSLISEDAPNPLARPLTGPPTHAHRHRSMPQQLLRPSVITCAPTPLMRELSGRTEMGSSAAAAAMGPGGPGARPGLGPMFLNGRAGGAERWSAGLQPPHHAAAQPHHAAAHHAAAHSAQNNSEMDPDIEEHFRRSLGRNYRETFSSPPHSSSASSPPTATSPSVVESAASSSSTSSASSSNNANEVNITGSVDDHFAKALGEKWSQIKDVIEPGTERSTPSSSPSLRVSSPRVSSSPVVQHQAPVAS